MKRKILAARFPWPSISPQPEKSNAVFQAERKVPTATWIAAVAAAVSAFIVTTQLIQTNFLRNATELVEQQRAIRLDLESRQKLIQMVFDEREVYPLRARVESLQALIRLEKDLRDRGVIRRTVIDLSGLNFSCTISSACADLREMDLSFVDLSGANLRGARFQGARLLFSTLIGSDLSYARLSNVRVSGARFREDLSDVVSLPLNDLVEILLESSQFAEAVVGGYPLVSKFTSENSKCEPEALYGLRFALRRKRTIGGYFDRLSPRKPPADYLKTQDACRERALAEVTEFRGWVLREGFTEKLVGRKPLGLGMGKLLDALTHAAIVEGVTWRGGNLRLSSDTRLPFALSDSVRPVTPLTEYKRPEDWPATNSGPEPTN